MLIRCWGSRGSIPVSGKEFLKYGGDTTCLEVRSSQGDLIIIDAGTGIRKLGNSLSAEKIKKIDILITHAHLDHLMGFPFFAPLFFSNTKITVHGPKLSKDNLRDVINDFLAEPYFPIQIDSVDIRSSLKFKTISTLRSFNIGNLKITPIPLSHPKNGGLGFKFEENGKKFVFLTDNELGYVHTNGLPREKYVNFCKDADLVIHDAEYTEADYDYIFKNSEIPWGHSLFLDAVKLGIDSNAKKFGLFHLNNRRTDKDVDKMVDISQKYIQKHKSKLECFAVGTGYEIKI